MTSIPRDAGRNGVVRNSSRGLTVRGVSAALIVMGLAACAQASLLFETGFETTDHAGYVAGDPLVGFDGWAASLNPQDEDRNGEMIVSDAAAFSGTQSGRMYGVLDGTSTQTRWRNSLDEALPHSELAAGEFIRWSLVVMVPEEEAGLWLYTVSGTTFTTSHYGVSLRFRTTGAADVNDSNIGNPVIAPAGSLVPQTWYRWTMDLHPNAATPHYNVLIEDTSDPNLNWSLDDIPFRGTPNALRSIMFMTVGGNEGAYVDDIRLEIIPEPGVAGLLVVGLGLLALRRRRG